MSKEKEIAQLEKVIADPRTSAEEKAKFQKIVDKLKSTKPKKKSVDLFEKIDTLPNNVQAIIQKYSLEDEDYKVLEKLKEELEPEGYTFDYGLDAVPYNLRKISKTKSYALVNSLLDEKDKIPEPKKESKKVEYDCDELIKEQKERAKKAKEAAAKRAEAPKKSEVTKDKEKIEKVEENVRDRVESGKATKAELQKLIKETTELLNFLKKALSKL